MMRVLVDLVLSYLLYLCFNWLLFLILYLVPACAASVSSVIFLILGMFTNGMVLSSPHYLSRNLYGLAV